MNNTSLDKNILSTYLLKSFILINGTNILLNINKSDSIVSILIGFSIGILLISLFSKKNNTIFNSDFFFKKPILLILIVCVLIFSSQLLYSTSMFINYSLLNNVNITPISILFVGACVYLSLKGTNTILRTSSICFYIFLLLEFISIAFITPNIDSSKILPLFTNSFQSILKGSYIYIILSISPLFLIACVPFEDKKSTKKTYIFTSIYILFNLLILLSVVDKNLAVRLDYPEVFILSKISSLNFFDRMESVLCFKYLFDLFFTITMSIYYIKEAIKTVYKHIPYIDIIIGTIIVFISNTIQYNNHYIVVSLLVFLSLNIILLFKKRT